MELNIPHLPVGDLEGLRAVGSGGFGTVYRGKSKTLFTEVAWKVVHRMSREELEKEAEIMHKANYTYVLRVLCTYVDDQRGEFGLVMEYMPHGSLTCLLEKVEGVPWALKFQILHQVVLGMNYLHHVLEPPILHRDLKPDNVLLDCYLDVKLTDFGLARKETLVSTARDGSPGTLSYMPPEALLPHSDGYKAVKAFDVYSFAILIWSVLAGKEPYKDLNLQWVKHFVPKNHRPKMKLVECWNKVKMVSEAIELMQKCWAGEPSNRPSFSHCKNKTHTMYEEYAGDIKEAKDKVLTKLKEISSSSSSSASQVSQDVPDGRFKFKVPERKMDVINNVNQLIPPAVDGASVDISEQEPDIKDAKEFIENNYYHIVQETLNLSRVLDELFTQQFITKELKNKIQRLDGVENQAREILLVIINQGQESCKNFLSLMWRHQRSVFRNLQY